MGAPVPTQRAAERSGRRRRPRAWREKAPLDRAKEVLAKYSAAGVAIEVVKFDRVFQLSDGELDYAFSLAKALGARAVSCEISKPVADTKRVGQFADKHKMMIGYHGHAETTPADWEEAFGFAQYNGANLDIGHFIVGNKTSPIPFLEKHHARITHLHIKDRQTAGAERAVRPGRHADQRRAAAPEEDRLADSGDDRVRVPGAGRIDAHGRDREGAGLLPEGAGVGRCALKSSGTTECCSGTRVTRTSASAQAPQRQFP